MTMKIFVIIFLRALVVAAENDCNATLPWSIDRSSHPRLTGEQFSKLLRCPENLNGCGDAPVSCSGHGNLWTCSCADNCDVYGDCCWEKSTSLDSRPSSSCIRVDIEDKYYRDIAVVSGCQRDWPPDEVRDGCENQAKYNDTFYRTPLTSASGITYYNGYCALCNYDMEGVTFWNVSCQSAGSDACGGPTGAPLRVTLPNVVLDNNDAHLHPCDVRAEFIDTCGESISDVARRCETYFAPVQSSKNDSVAVYKNVYCALCNAKDVSTMKCSPPYELFNHSRFSEASIDVSGPNLVQLLRPVSSRNGCRFWQGNKCFIPKVEYRYNNHSTGVANGTADTNRTSTRIKLVFKKQNVQVYFTIACLSISLLCLALKALVYVVFKGSRGFSSKCTLCLSCTLFFSHLLFLLANSFALPRLPCVISAMFLHFGFLSAFFWTTVLASDIWKGVAAVKLARGRTRAFPRYCIVAWGSPLCLVLTCAAIDYAVPSFLLAPRYGQAACWISNIKALAVFFLTPMVSLLVLNAIFYVHIIIHVSKTTQQAADFDFRAGGQRSRMRLYVKLALIMGATWMLGFACVYVVSVITDVIFIMSVGLQGVYLFFGFKDYRYFIDAVRGRKIPPSNTSGNGTSTELPQMEGNSKSE
ncbi:adhesion G protein-coupled receptor E5-like [Ornithodoros turicata]|uniref:adhesion G protein-coupled receptor E5-like n=1 Tax=Ornithodoros turicata TaxID=34597 RepID=UPI00313888CF